MKGRSTNLMITNGGARTLRRAILVAGTVVVGHTVTSTEHIHGTFDPELTSPNPCSGADIVSADAVGNGVMHETYFPAGDEVWATFTETGQVTVLDSNDVTYTGRLTVWGNFN
jgi:hypothetical protein